MGRYRCCQQVARCETIFWFLGAWRWCRQLARCRTADWFRRTQSHAASCCRHDTNFSTRDVTQSDFLLSRQRSARRIAGLLAHLCAEPHGSLSTLRCFRAVCCMLYTAWSRCFEDTVKTIVDKTRYTFKAMAGRCGSKALLSCTTVFVVHMFSSSSSLWLLLLLLLRRMTRRKRPGMPPRLSEILPMLGVGYVS